MILREVKNIYVPIQQIEYLESTGTQYIDTEVYANLDTSVDVKFCFTEIFPDNSIITSDMGNSGTNCFSLNYYYETNYPWGIVLSIDGVSAVAYKGTTERALAWFEVNASKRGLVINNVFYPLRYQPSNFTSNYSLFMFAYGRNGVPIIFGKSRITYLKIYNNGTLIRYFIPVRVGSVGYMYDRVSKRLFGNKGTGNFVLGQDVVDSGLQQIYQNKLIEGVDYETADWLKGDGIINTSGDLRNVSMIELNFKTLSKNATGDRLFGRDAGYKRLLCGRVSAASFAVWGVNAESYFNYLPNEEYILKFNLDDGNVSFNSDIRNANFAKINEINLKLTPFNNYSISLLKYDDTINLVPCTLLRSIPRNLDAQCKERVAGECGMIDLISGKFYGNVASSGTFTVENDNNE